MNTANLQLEGLYAAVAALTDALREKGVLSASEIDQALRAAETRIAVDPKRPAELSASHVEAICFPLRYLRAANQAGAEGRQATFTELATEVGRSKPDH